MSSEVLGKKLLGKSDIEVTPIGLGAWQFSEGKFFNSAIWDPIDRETTHAIIKKAVEEGINWFDTAEAYGMGRSERGLSSGLQAAGIPDDKIRIATKWWPLF